MDKSRRAFLGKAAALTAGAALVPLSEVEAGLNDQPPRREGDARRRYGMAIDLRRCIGCQACTVACSLENQAPMGQFRTVVHQYEVADADGSGVASFMLPRLCNQCDQPPCVPVCPVQATFQRKDGIVVVDNERCVACGYCVQACPYDARFINHDTQTADKCNFCVHRLEVGLLPACVETCVGGARVIGDLNDPDSDISRLLRENRDDVKVLKPEMGTRPHVFYIGMTDAFLNRIQGQQGLWFDSGHGKPASQGGAV
jgi:tetrathionate reductase subunit B